MFLPEIIDFSSEVIGEERRSAYDGALCVLNRSTGYWDA